MAIFRNTGKIERVMFRVNEELWNRMRNAIAGTTGATITSFCESAIRHEIERLERERGEAFPPRKREPKRGRPRKRVEDDYDPERGG